MHTSTCPVNKTAGLTLLPLDTLESVLTCYDKDFLSHANLLLHVASIQILFVKVF